jgi:hypothetical protein
MRVVFLIAALPVLYYVSAAAQTDEIGLYTDPGYTECTLADTGARTVNVYVVHSTLAGSRASQFRVRSSSGATLTYLSEQSPWLTLGDSQSGVAVAYGECLYSDIPVMTISYFASGSSSTCSYLQVVADPKSGESTVRMVRCSGGEFMEGSGSRLVINSDGSCECGATTVFTNWGKVKARFARD